MFSVPESSILWAVNLLIKSFPWFNCWFSSNDSVKCKVTLAVLESCSGWSWKSVDVTGWIVGGLLTKAFKVTVWNTLWVSPPWVVSDAYIIYLCVPAVLSSNEAGV